MYAGVLPAMAPAMMAVGVCGNYGPEYVALVAHPSVRLGDRWVRLVVDEAQTGLPL